MRFYQAQSPHHQGCFHCTLCVVILTFAALCATQVLEAVCVTLDVKPGKVKDDSGKMVNDFWKPSVALMNERVGGGRWAGLGLNCVGGFMGYGLYKRVAVAGLRKHVVETRICLGWKPWMGVCFKGDSARPSGNRCSMLT